VIFLDTSAVYALADRDDRNHETAVRAFTSALQRQEEFLLHNYVIVESTALLHRRLGWGAARQFVQDAAAFRVTWVDETLHREAVRRWQRRRGRVSLVDQVSFLIMGHHGIRTFLGFDDDFTREGFKFWRAP